MTAYNEDDVREARPDELPVIGTDVALSVGRQGDDLTLWVNKAGIQVLRIRLKDGAKAMTTETLLGFSTFSPDFVFTIGDSAEGLARLKRSLGLVD